MGIQGWGSLQHSQGFPMKTFNQVVVYLPLLASTLIPTVSALGAECSSWTYYTLDSVHRNVAAPVDSTPCGDNWWCTDTSGYENTAPDWKMGGVWGDQPSWYRVVSPAGSKLLTEPPGEKRCSTMATGWLEGSILKKRERPWKSSHSLTLTTIQ